MSRKLTAFRAATILPQVTCNYQIFIPSIMRSVAGIEAASLPFKKTVSQSVYIRGLQYQIPVKLTAQGNWSCTMSENMFMSAMYQSLGNMYKMKGGEYEFELGNIYIFITDALTGLAPVAVCVLKGCYLTEIKELSLSASGATEVMKVQLIFQYNDILDPIKLVDTITGSKFELTRGDFAETMAIQAAVAGVTATAWGVSKLTSKLPIEELLKG